MLSQKMRHTQVGEITIFLKLASFSVSKFKLVNSSIVLNLQSCSFTKEQ